MLIKRLIVLFALVLPFTLLYSQQLLDLEQCRKLAIENNKALKVASESVKKAHYEKKEAFMKFFPKFSASGTYMHFSKDLQLIGNSQIPSKVPNFLTPEGGFIEIPAGIRDAIIDVGRVDLSQLWTMGISMTQPLFMGGRIVAYNDLMSYAKELAVTMKETAMTDVIVETDETYWQVVAVANKTKLAEAYVKLLKRMDSDMQALFEEGMITKADRLSVAVKLNEAEIAQTKAQNGLTLSKMLLCEIIGLDITENISLKDENLSSLTLEETSIPMPANLESAIDNRTEIRSLELVEKIYKKQEKIAFADFLPEAGLQVGYNWMKPNMFNGVQNNFSGLWNIAVSVKVPLNFISSDAKYKAAQSATAMQRYELEDAKEKIKLQINQASFKLEEARKVLRATTKNAEKANENLRYANDGFEEGVMPTSDVLAAHAAWVGAQSERIDAQIDLKLCKVYLNRALGRNIAQ